MLHLPFNRCLIREVVLKKYRVGICDSDTGYVVGFMEYVNMNDKIPIKVSAFSGVDAVLEYIKDSRLDLLLLDEENELKKTDLNIVRLTDRKELDNKNSIYKYQSIYKIVDYIVHLLDEGNKVNIDDCLVYGIYSPVGRCGKTTLAKGICQNYEESLYIGFEEYSAEPGKIYDQQRYKELYERFMYFLLGKNNLIIDTLREIREKNGKNYFVTLDYRDLRQIETSHIEWLVKLLKEECHYKRIVFDMGVGVLNDFKILLCFDRVFIPILNNNSYSKNKINSFKAIVSEKIYSVLVKKIKYVEVPKTAFDSRDMKDFILQDGI